MNFIKKHIGFMGCIILLLLLSAGTAFAEGSDDRELTGGGYGGELAVGDPEGESAVLDLEDGEYSVSLEMSGGSGKASVTSPTLMRVEDGIATADITWSSSNYDYMVVDGETYYNLSEEGADSRFEIPIPFWDEGVEVIADTTAMGDPVEVHYTFYFSSDSIGSKGQLPREAAKRVILVAAAIIVFGGILNFALKRRSKY